MRIPYAVISALLLAGGLAACGGEALPEEDAPNPELPESIDGEVGIVTYDDGSADGGEDALLEGTVVIDNGCLVIESTMADDDSHTIPAVPEQHLSIDEGRISLYGVEIEEGDTLAFGGGSTIGNPGHLMVPPECEDLSDDYFISWTMEKR